MVGTVRPGAQVLLGQPETVTEVGGTRFLLERNRDDHPMPRHPQSLGERHLHTDGVEMFEQMDEGDRVHGVVVEGGERGRVTDHGVDR